MRRILVLGLVLVFLFSVAGCGSGGDSGGGSDGKNKPIRIGVVAGITGPSALPGQCQVNAVKLAVEEINAAGGVNGRQIELIVEDSQSTNPGAVAAFQKAAGQDVSAIIGPVFSTAVQAMMPYMEKYKLSVLVGGTDALITKSGNPWVFRLRPSDVISTKVMAQFMATDLKAKKIAILHDTDAFGTGAKKGIEEALKDYPGVESKAFGMTSHSGDFTAQLVNIKQYNPGAMVILSPYPEDGAIIMRQIKELGITAQMLGSAAVASANTVKLAKENSNGLYGVTDYFRDQNDAAKAYFDKYQSKFGAPPDLYSAYAYDAVYILSKIIAQNGENPEKIHQGMRAFKGNGVEGEYSFDANGDGITAYTIIQIKSGKPEFVKVVKIQ